MNRRSFLKSIAALAAVPTVSPLGSSLIAAPASAAAAIPPSTYKWAETIVRAHRSCTTAMLQRHLGLEAATAQALQRQLIANGVVSSNVSAYGVRAAIKPLSDAAFLKPGGMAKISAPTVDRAKAALDAIAPDETDQFEREQTAFDMREPDDIDGDVAGLCNLHHAAPPFAPVHGFS